METFDKMDAVFESGPVFHEWLLFSFVIKGFDQEGKIVENIEIFSIEK